MGATTQECVSLNPLLLNMYRFLIIMCRPSIVDLLQISLPVATFVMVAFSLYRLKRLEENYVKVDDNR